VTHVVLLIALAWQVSGTGQALIEPFLDNMVAYKNTDPAKKPTKSRYHARVLEGVAKSQSPLTVVVFESQQP